MDLSNELEKLTVDDVAKDFREKEKGVASLFIIKVEPGRIAYRYDVDILDVARKRSLAKAADDGQRALNRNLCYEILATAHRKTGGFGMDGQIVYDCKATMFSSKQLNLDDSCIPIDSSEVDDYVREYCGDANFEVKILLSAASPELALDNLTQYTANGFLQKEDRSVRTFLEMAITQYSLNNNFYTPVGTGRLFEIGEENAIDVENGMVLRSGVAKGVRIVENFGCPRPALVLDAKICPFFKAQNLVDTVTAILQTGGDWGKVRRLLQDVRVEVSYAKHRSFTIGGWTDKPISTFTIDYEKEKITLPVYFQKRYGFNVEHPHMLAVIPTTLATRQKMAELFPVEALLIMEDQRVPLEKMDKNLQAKVLKASTLPPSKRLQTIMRHAEEMAVFNDDNAVLRSFGIQVLKNSNEVEIGIRQAPDILFANDKIVQPSAVTTDWSKTVGNAQYLDSSRIDDWIVVCTEGQETLIGDFVKMMMETAESKGLVFTKQPVISGVKSTFSWTALFKECRDKSVTFVLLVASKVDDLHGPLKYYEARYKILTQHITLERVVDMVKNNRAQTLENILMKTNCKNYGLNYAAISEASGSKFDLGMNEVLIIGYDVAHPPPVNVQTRRMLQAKGMEVDSLEPSVVGICANMAKNPHAFVGDYFYQESRKEAVDVVQLADRITWILQMLANNRPKASHPKFVFILRDGLSEGQYAMAIDEELNSIKRGFSAFDEVYEPKVVFVIGTKRHFKKFFAFKNGEFQNLTPGSVIQDKFVRKDCKEFFMQSHYPLQGVGKSVEYSVLKNEFGATEDEIQGMLSSLCYSHQIVNSSVSLPEPIYQADELAKRGLDNFLTMKRLEEDKIPRSKNRVVDHAALNAILSYRNSGLDSTRFTA